MLASTFWIRCMARSSVCHIEAGGPAFGSQAHGQSRAFWLFRTRVSWYKVVTRFFFVATLNLGSLEMWGCQNHRSYSGGRILECLCSGTGANIAHDINGNGFLVFIIQAGFSSLFSSSCFLVESCSNQFAVASTEALRLSRCSLAAAHANRPAASRFLRP